MGMEPGLTSRTAPVGYLLRSLLLDSGFECGIPMMGCVVVKRRVVCCRTVLSYLCAIRCCRMIWLVGWEN